MTGAGGGWRPSDRDIAESAQYYGAWVRDWADRIGQGTTILADGVRFTPGMLRALRDEVGALDPNQARFTLVAALVQLGVTVYGDDAE